MRRARAIAALAIAWAVCGSAAHESDLPDLGEPLYEAPAPGTYELPAIGHVDEHETLARDGSRAPLLGLGRDEAAIVSFIYRNCTQASGCPLALATLKRLDRAIAHRPELAARVTLVTVSFDPARDTPARMAELRELMQPHGRWRFLTPPDQAALEKLLADFGQDVLREVDEHGETNGVLRHVLKVFLIDGDRAVRNVYSTGFLNPDLILNDLATVLGAY